MNTATRVLWLITRLNAGHNAGRGGTLAKVCPFAHIFRSTLHHLFATVRIAINAEGSPVAMGRTVTL